MRCREQWCIWRKNKYLRRIYTKLANYLGPTFFPSHSKLSWLVAHQVCCVVHFNWASLQRRHLKHDFAKPCPPFPETCAGTVAGVDGSKTASNEGEGLAWADFQSYGEMSLGTSYKLNICEVILLKMDGWHWVLLIPGSEACHPAISMTPSWK